ncbi:MAG: hypothetical protein WCT04_08990 [Planctomycetota bacterium]
MRYVLAGVICIAAAALASAADREWNSYQPGNGVCYIKFPANPEYQMQLVDSAATHIYIAKDSTRTPMYVYVLGFCDYPKERLAEKDAIKKLLDSDRDSFVKSVNGKVVSEKPIKIESAAGRTLVISGEDGQARWLLREVLIDNRVFQLAVCVPKNDVNDADAAKFFDSFHLPRK